MLFRRAYAARRRGILPPEGERFCLTAQQARVVWDYIEAIDGELAAQEAQEERSREIQLKQALAGLGR